MMARGMNKGLKLTLIVAGLLAGLLAGGYAAAPTLVEIVARHNLRDFVHVGELEIESVGLEEANITRLQLDNKQMRFSAQHAVIEYSLWPPAIKGIDIARSALSIESFAPGPAGGGAAPALPDFPLHIEALELTAPTPWGGMAVPLSISSEPGSSGGLRAIVNGPGFSARLTNPGADRHELELAAGDTVLASLSADDGGTPVALAGRVDVQAAAEWLQHAEFVPAALRSAIASYAVVSGGIRFNAELNGSTDFQTRLRGDVMVRDERDAASRRFTSLELTSPQYTLTRSGSNWSGTGNGGVALALTADTVLSIEDPTWRLEDGGLALSADTPAYTSPSVRADSLELTTPRFTASRAEGGIRLRGVQPAGWPEDVSPYAIDGDWSWRGGVLQAEGQATGRALPTLEWSADTRGDRGSAEVRLRHEIADLTSTLQVYTQAVARELAVKSGRVGGACRIEWNADGWRTSLDLSAGPLDADLDEMEVRGLSIRAANPEDTLQPLVVSANAPSIKLAAGTVTENFEAKFRLAYPHLHIDEVRTELFDGRFSVRPTSVDLQAEEWVVLVDVHGLSLDKIMALLELETTQLTGEVSGRVRVVLGSDGSVAIDEGELHSTRPGVLKFSMSPQSDTAAELDNIALQALRDFQYDELKATIRYRPDGEYRVKARIVGNNPNVLQGHPIALNPDIEGRLPALFRAFFITGDFSRAIIERLREERSTSTSGETSTFQED